MPKFGAYIASKVALETLCDVLQAETAGANAPFSIVHIGLVRTPMIAPSRDFDTFPALSPQQAADIVCETLVHRPRHATTPIGRITAAGDANVHSPSRCELVCSWPGRGDTNLNNPCARSGRRDQSRRSTAQRAQHGRSGRGACLTSLRGWSVQSSRTEHWGRAYRQGETTRGWFESEPR